MLKNLKTKLAFASVGVLGLVAQAQAAVPPEVETALKDMNTDTMKVAAAFLAVSIGVAAYLKMRTAAK